VRTPATTELLGLWESGQGASGAARGSLLLEAAFPDRSTPSLPLGRRDTLLIELHERLFGSRVDALASCPACHEAVETEVSLGSVRSAAPEIPVADRLTFEEDGYEIEARLPTGEDLEAAAATGDVEAARAQIVARCVAYATRGGRDVAWNDLPPHVVAALGEHLAQADPLADVSFRLTCPACGEEWGAPFDVLRFLWQGLEGLAERLLGEVHELASAYGWTEAEILGLSHWRRQRYLEQVRA